MLVFLIGFSLWVPFRQADAIEKFTQANAISLETDSLSEKATEVEVLGARFTSFRDDLADEQAEVRLALDVDDLNLAIARYPAVEELRGSFRVREIVDGKLVIDICYQVNGRPRFTRDDESGMVTSDARYLVGTIYGHPMLSSRELVLKVDRLVVPGVEIPEGFMGHFSTLRLFEKSRKDPEIGPVMGKLTQVVVEDGKLVLARVPGEPIPDVISDEAFQQAGGKMAIFLGAAFLIFLLFAGTLLYFGYRTKLRKLRESEETSGAYPDA